jgi:hypothetical protein
VIAAQAVARATSDLGGSFDTAGVIFNRSKLISCERSSVVPCSETDEEGADGGHGLAAEACLVVLGDVVESFLKQDEGFGRIRIVNMASVSDLRGR